MTLGGRTKSNDALGESTTSPTESPTKGGRGSPVKVTTSADHRFDFEKEGDEEEEEEEEEAVDSGRLVDLDPEFFKELEKNRAAREREAEARRRKLAEEMKMQKEKEQAERNAEVRVCK